LTSSRRVGVPAYGPTQTIRARQAPACQGSCGAVARASGCYLNTSPSRTTCDHWVERSSPRYMSWAVSPVMTVLGTVSGMGIPQRDTTGACPYAYGCERSVAEFWRLLMAPTAR